MGLFSFGKKRYDAFAELGNWNDYVLFNAYGIVNPYGPTLMAIVAKKRSANNITVPMYLLQIHPFQPKIITKWDLSLDGGKTGVGFGDIATDITGEYAMGSCPTLLIEGNMLEHDMNVLLFRLIAHRSPSGKETLERCRKFEGDPFNRVTAEIDSTLEKMSTDMDAFIHGEPKIEFMTEDETQDFIDMQLEYLPQEFKAFVTAYKGAIKHVPQLKAQFPFEAFDKFVQELILK